MKYFLILTFLLTFLIAIFCQSKNVDSLHQVVENKIANQQIDSSLYKDYYTLAIHYYRSNQDSSLYYFSKAIRVGKSLQHGEYIAKCAFNSTLIYKRKGNYNAVDSLLEICIDASPSEYMVARCLKGKGDNHMKTGNYHEAEESFKRALDLGRSQKDTSFLANVYNGFALLYDYKGDYDLSIENHIKSRDIELYEGDSIGYAISNCNIAILLNRMEEYEKALDYVSDAESYINQDDCYHMYQIYDGKGTYYKYKKKYNKSEAYYTKALNCTVGIGAEDMQASAYQNLISVSYANGNNHKTLEYISQGLKLSSLIPSRRARMKLIQASILLDEQKCNQALSLLKQIEHQIKQDFDFVIKSSYFKNIARANACIGNYNSFEKNLTQSFLSVDSAHSETKANQARIIEARYSTKIKADSINILQLEHQNQKYMIANQRNGLIGSIAALIACLLLLRFLFSRYSQTKQLNDNLIFEKQELLQLNDKLKENLISKADSKPQLPSNKLEIKSLNKVQIVEVSDIIYASSEEQGVRIHMSNRSFWCSMKLKEIQNQLPEENFIKIYRSVIININQVEWFNHATLKMINGDELKIGRTYKSDIQRLLN